MFFNFFDNKIKYVIKLVIYLNLKIEAQHLLLYRILFFSIRKSTDYFLSSVVY